MVQEGFDSPPRHCHNPVASTQHNTMYYIIIDGVQHGFSLQWEEALIEAAQQDHMLNSPELNDGIQGTQVDRLGESPDCRNEFCSRP